MSLPHPPGGRWSDRQITWDSPFHGQHRAWGTEWRDPIAGGTGGILSTPISSGIVYYHSERGKRSSAVTVTPRPSALPQLHICSSLAQTIERPCCAVEGIARSLLDGAATIYSAAVAQAAYLSEQGGSHYREGSCALPSTPPDYYRGSRQPDALYKHVSGRPKHLGP